MKRKPNRQRNRPISFVINAVIGRFIFIRLCLFKREDGAAYDLVVDVDVHAIGTAPSALALRL